MYNIRRVTPAELSTYEALGDPRWKGRLGWAPANASFQDMVTAMRVLWGEAKAQQWLEGLKANGAREYPNNTAIVAAVGSGEIEVGFVNHYYLYRFLQERGESFPARNYHPRAGGPGALVLVAGVGVLDTSQNRENAERFVAFLLSLVGQQYFASQTYEYPLVKGVTVHRELTPLAEIKSPNLPLKELADLAGTQTLLRKVGVLP
jgi:iron(III) transport system substrate-binding protein